MSYIWIKNQLCSPSFYWTHHHLLTFGQTKIKELSHKGIVAQMVLDFQPLSLVNNRGFVINTRQVNHSHAIWWLYSHWEFLRLTMPQLRLHGPGWYRARIEKVVKLVYKWGWLLIFACFSVLLPPVEAFWQSWLRTTQPQFGCALMVGVLLLPHTLAPKYVSFWLIKSIDK